MQIVTRIMANSQKTTANKTTTSITHQPRVSQTIQLKIEGCAGLRGGRHTLKCHLTNWSSDLAKKQKYKSMGSKRKAIGKVHKKYKILQCEEDVSRVRMKTY